MHTWVIAVPLLKLVLVTAPCIWLLDAIYQAARQYVRSGAVMPRQGRRLLTRGAVGLGAYVFLALLPASGSPAPPGPWW